jgi:hypothetical protein
LLFPASNPSSESGTKPAAEAEAAPKVIVPRIAMCNIVFIDFLVLHFGADNVAD